MTFEVRQIPPPKSGVQLAFEAVIAESDPDDLTHGSGLVPEEIVVVDGAAGMTMEDAQQIWPHLWDVEQEAPPSIVYHLFRPQTRCSSEDDAWELWYGWSYVLFEGDRAAGAPAISMMFALPIDGLYRVARGPTARRFSDVGTSFLTGKIVDTPDGTR